MQYAVEICHAHEICSANYQYPRYRTHWHEESLNHALACLQLLHRRLYADCRTATGDPSGRILPGNCSPGFIRQMSLYSLPERARRVRITALTSSRTGISFVAEIMNGTKTKFTHTSDPEYCAPCWRHSLPSKMAGEQCRAHGYHSSCRNSLATGAVYGRYGI